MTPVLRIRARPLPAGCFLAARVPLEPSTDSAAFGVHPSGWIFCGDSLTMNPRKCIILECLPDPRGQIVTNVSTSVIVHVLDENDNSPTFLHDVLFLKVQRVLCLKG